MYVMGVPEKDMARFFSKILFVPGSCWFWLGGVTQRQGYGRFWFNGKEWPAHRFSYEIAAGKLPKTLVLDHLCREPACVNPLHLEPTSAGDNVMRGMSPAAQRHRALVCKRGHSYADPANVSMLANGERRCRTCGREKQRARMLALKGRRTCT